MLKTRTRSCAQSKGKFNNAAAGMVGLHFFDLCLDDLWLSWIKPKIVGKCVNVSVSFVIL